MRSVKTPGKLVLSLDTYFVDTQDDHKSSYMYYMQKSGNHILAFWHERHASLGYGDGHAGCYTDKEVVAHGESEQDSYPYKSWLALMPNRKW
jgi:hypothetical protein